MKPHKFVIEWSGLIIALTCLIPLSAATAAPAETPSESQGQACNGACKSCTQPADEPLLVVYFHVSTCAECRKCQGIIQQVAQEWGERIQLEVHDVGQMESLEAMFLYADHYGKDVEAPPAVFLGGVAITETDGLAQRLNAAIRDCLAAGQTTWSPQQQDLSPEIRRRAALAHVIDQFRGFRVGAVALAGLVDGVNPCAFTTIVFMLSMLAYVGRSRKDLLIVGVTFTLTFFCTYMLLGLGLLSAVKSFSVRSGVAKGLAYVVGIGAIGLAVWSFVDFVRYLRTRDVKTVTLSLPRSIKERIHRVIRSGMKTRNLALGAVSVGFAVSLLEALCTGQLYLPTIVFVARAPGMRASALGYLLLYNVLFTLPLAVIMVVAYLGVKSETMGNFLHRHLAAAKLALAVIFAVLGLLVIATV